MKRYRLHLLLVITALLASCEGRCRASDAVADEVPGGVCAVGTGDLAICLRGDEVLMCSVQGEFSHTASCSRLGKIDRGAR